MMAPDAEGVVNRLDGAYSVGYVAEWRKHPDATAQQVQHLVHPAGLAQIVTRLREERDLAADVLGAELRDEWRFRLVDYPDGVPTPDLWNGPMDEERARRVAAQCVRITMKRPDGAPRKVAVEYQRRAAWWLDLPDGPARFHVTEWQDPEEE